MRGGNAPHGSELTQYGRIAVNATKDKKEQTAMMFSGRDLSKILLPLVLEQILGVTVGIADSMMVSSVGEAAVSGISLVDSINLFMFNVYAALATGGAVVCSQFLGRKDLKAARDSAKMLYYVLFAVSTLLMTAALVFRGSLLSLIFGKIDAAVMDSARIYFLFTSLSYPFIALYNGGAAIFRAMGNSSVSLAISLGMNLLNVAGNAVFIFICGFGAAGAGIATLISRVIGAAVIVALSHRRSNTIYVDNLFRFSFNFFMIKNIFRIGIPAGLENGMFQFGKLMTQSLVSTFPTPSIAANAVANSIVSFEYAVGGAVGMTMITVVGRCVGAGEKEQAKHYTKRLVGTAYAIMIAIALTLTLLAGPVLRIYNLSDESRVLARHIILVHNLFAAVFWPSAFALPHAFRAAGDVSFTMIVAIFSMWTFRVGCSYLLAYRFDLGVLSVWYAMMIDWIFRAALFLWRYFSGRWLRKAPLSSAKQ